MRPGSVVINRLAKIKRIKGICELACHQNSANPSEHANDRPTMSRLYNRQYAGSIFVKTHGAVDLSPNDCDDDR